ncbi:MAG: 16S rRNA (uracil(1498)-N(3))-methyltransferase [Alphaproteobacteria bacterium]
MAYSPGSPRLYVTQALQAGAAITLEKAQAHYLKNVMRMQAGASLRLFNGQHGEYRAEITDFAKNHAELELKEQNRPQPPARAARHLIFSPIKKHRMDFLVEKAVELGVTHLHPALMQRTELRKINEDRLHAQIIESAEQCERLDIPELLPLQLLPNIIGGWAGPEILWAAERTEAPHIKSIENKSAFLIGPEGGFTPEEIEVLGRQKKIRAVSLSPDILRAETAALYCLTIASA